MIKNNSTPRIVLGITGASGAIYGIRILEHLSRIKAHIHLIISKAAELTIQVETNSEIKDLAKLATKTYDNQAVYEDIASGSFKHDGMIIAPCSITTMSSVATGINNNLICRAADVCLKERRKLVMMVRETPFHLGHLHSMEKLTQMGAIIFPPIPSFYNNPQTIDDIINQSTGRVLDLFNLSGDIIRRWDGKIE